MDTLEFNKIAGSLLFTLLVIMGLGFLAEFLYAPPALEQQAYVVALPEGEAEAGGEAEAEAEAEPLAVVLAAGDAGNGAKVAKKCAACHTFEEGKTKPQGPNLHGVVGRPMASTPGFAYSDALKARGAAGDSWTYENLFGFLEAPKKYIEGTAMTFSGLRKAGDRADVIAFLRDKSPDAPPLPAADDTSAAAGESGGQ